MPEESSDIVCGLQYPESFDNNVKNVKSTTVDISICKGCKLSINKTFLPVKAALFCWFAAGNIEEVYLPVFLKLQGFSLVHLSLFSAISVIFQFSSTIFTGILTDKTGRPKIILMCYFMLFSSICLAFMFTPNVKECNTKEINFQCIYDTDSQLSTRASCNVFKNLSTISCTIAKSLNFSHDHHTRKCMLNNSVIEMVTIKYHEMENNTNLCHYTANLKNSSSKSISLCETDFCKSVELDCTIESSSDCNENRRMWIIIYGIMLVLLNVSFTVSYRLFDIIVVDLTHEHNNDFGRQKIWSTLGSLSGPPIAGFLLQTINITRIEKSYTVAFITIIVFTILSAFFLWQVETKLYKPSAKLWRKALVLGRKLEIWFFVPLVLVMGSCYGFRAIYSSWYLQGIGASDLLIGVARGMSGIYGLPFLYSSKWWINKIGYRAIFLPSLLGFSIYCFSFSILEVPWPAVVIELTSVLGIYLYWVAVMHYTVQIAPEGLEATVKVLAGGIQFSLGKVITTTIGGYLMSEYGGKVAFRTLGSMALIYAVIYGSYLSIEHLQKKKSQLNENPIAEEQLFERKIIQVLSE
ncbi:hypothetical protein TNCT_687081 [Trichonephila clavata]|uniref:Major facilitator superfamily associated domain-containing protein n=1 Tax=Trichonephila clavata TaxID=2740835 RepID=A0A8X6H9I4_TRICU|nr:hypothetical protein TNCT_687081 [Trichonephila clavata]